MPATVVIVAICLVGLGFALCAAAVRAFRRRRWLGGGLRGLAGLLFVVINLVVDLLYYAVDPRLRIERLVAAH